MGRVKIEIKPIENKKNRRITLYKRLGGLIKKAGELSVLCKLDVGLMAFSGDGKRHDFSAGDSLDRIVQRYQSGTPSTCSCVPCSCVPEKELMRKKQLDLEEENQLLRKKQLALEEELSAARIAGNKARDEPPRTLQLL